MMDNPTPVTASYYGEPGSYFNGRRAADGSRFDGKQMTAAHRTLPYGTMLQLRGSRGSVWVRITDRGPFIRGRQLDLSYHAFRRVEPVSRGVARLQLLRVVYPSPRSGTR